jgi:CheY-like chemotaxis protein
MSHLARVGLAPALAENGKIGVELARAAAQNGEEFELILMDIHMPVMDGLDAMRVLRDIGVETPIVALTANAMSTDRERYLSYGMADYLSKPFTSQELWSCLLRHIAPVPEDDASTAESTGPAEQPLIENDILNERRGIERTGGDEALYTRIRRNFIAENGDMAGRLYDMARKGEFEAMHLAAHSLKSAARTIGAEKLGDAAYEIERSLANDDIARLTQKLKALDEAQRELIALLGPMEDASSRRDALQGSSPLDNAAALTLSQMLAPMLKDGNPESLRYVDDIWSTLSPLGQVCEDLADQIEDFEFDTAYETLNLIQDALERR